MKIGQDFILRQDNGVKLPKRSTRRMDVREMYAATNRPNTAASTNNKLVDLKIILHSVVSLKTAAPSSSMKHSVGAMY